MVSLVPYANVTLKKSFFLGYITVLLILATGCAPKNPLPLGKNYSSSSTNVPFVSPRSQLCASTAIQMVSMYWQAKMSYIPKLSGQELDGRTLIPAKGGTLQIELVAAARANGLIPYPLEPTFEVLFSELSAHHPVIVLVNRSYSWYQLWHYVTVNGYDADSRTVTIHFSDQPNEAVPIETFAALWKRSDNWGVVLLPPGELPVSISPKMFLRSAYEFEKTGMREESIVTYKSALSRWPDDVDILFALGTAYYYSNHLEEAEQSYRKILLIQASHPLACNNLALLLCHTSRSDEAMQILAKAVTDDVEIQKIIKATQEEIGAGCRENK